MNVVLTIDNGPYRDVTPQALAILADQAVQAIFFVIGERLDDPECRAIAERAHNEGHLVANHSQRHQSLLGDLPSDEEAVAEIALAEERLLRIGAAHRLFRPFAGMGQINDRLLTPAAVRYLSARRYTCALWNSVPRDWERPCDWDEVALADIQRRETSVIVIHDLPTGAISRLPHFIDGVRALGGHFTTALPVDCTPIRQGLVSGRVKDLAAGL